MAKFNERFSIALSKSGLTQTEFAEEIGIHKVQVNQYLNGRCQPNNIEMVIEMAKILNVSAPWLAGYDSPMDDFSHVVSSKFKNRLTEALREKNITSNQLAALINYNEKNVIEWIEGKSHPDFDTILLISKKIGVSMIWLVGCDVPMNSNEASDLVLKMYEELNDVGRKKVVEYINDLLDNPRYQKG